MTKTAIRHEICPAGIARHHRFTLTQVVIGSPADEWLARFHSSIILHNPGGVQLLLDVQTDTAAIALAAISEQCLPGTSSQLLNLLKLVTSSRAMT